MRILVTGGAGFIGSNYVRFLAGRYPDAEITVLDKLTYAGRMENLHDVRERITFILGDICNPADIENAGEVDAIVNFAAESHVDRSISDAMSFVRTDVLGTAQLLEHARRHDVDIFLQVGTDEVYGSRVSGSFTESDPLSPSSPYSASKAAADLLALAYFRTYGLPVLVSRSSNNFGGFQYPEKLIPVLILNAIRNRPLPIYGDGTNIRDWLYVENNCEALDRILRKGRRGEIYNVGGGNERTNLEIARLVLGELGKPADMIRFIPDRPGHDFRYSVDCGKIHALGWSPSVSLDEALGATVRWYVENRWWWEPLVGGPS
jgi:dTDP-glucose 4,6-dehydratase